MAVTSLRFDDALLALRPEDGWAKKNGSWWIAPEELDIRAMAGFMLSREARFITVTAMEGAGGETHIAFHWDVEGAILTFSTITRDNKAVSICDLCPGADWVEREIHEYFAVEFTGRQDTKPLMLRPGLAPGLNRRQSEKR